MVAIEHHQTLSNTTAITPSAAITTTTTHYNNNSLGQILSPVSTYSLSTLSSTTESIVSTEERRSTTNTVVSNNNNNTNINDNIMQDLQLPKSVAIDTTIKKSGDSGASSSSTTSAKFDGVDHSKDTSDKTSTDCGTCSKSAVSQRNVDIKISKKSQKDSQEVTKKILKLDLSGKDIDEYSLKSPKSPISARLSHQTSLTSSVDVEDRKTLREALYQGIFHRHRRTIFAVGSFLRMLRSRNSQYNTIRSSSEGEDIDETR